MADNLKDRIARLEAEVAEFRAALSQRKCPGWLSAAEKYAGDEDLLAVFAEARKLREAERQKVRHRKSNVGVRER